MGKLAINGGKAIRTTPFPSRQLYNKESIMDNLKDLIYSNNLSGYRGSFGQHFWGGKYVQLLEEKFEEYLWNKSVNSKEYKKYYVLAVNSCTSALQIACGAIGLKQFDEVIVTPWSMTCSATAPMIYGATPIFADIEKDHFCLDVNSIKEKITEKTKAIIAVDLFGQPFAKEINELAKEKGLYIIEDAAQAIGANREGISTGLLGDIGCFSFTQGKHFTCGEGGFIVTKNYDLYYKCALIRNHAEAVINSFPKDINYFLYQNMVGFNMRMTELQAAVLLEQLLPIHIEKERCFRKYNVGELSKKINIDGISWQGDRMSSCHSYYVLPFLFDEEKIGISREKFIDAVKAELTVCQTNMGVTTKLESLIWSGYVTPIYKMPLFKYQYKYMDIELANVEELQKKKFCMTSYQALPLSTEDIKDITNAFYKVYENIEELK